MSNNYQGIRTTKITMYLYLGANMITLMKNRTTSHPLFMKKIYFFDNIYDLIKKKVIVLLDLKVYN